eukprot:1144948-Amphidinium_carterae.1
MTEIAEGVPRILEGISPSVDQDDDVDMTKDGVSGLRAGTSGQDVKPPFRTVLLEEPCSRVGDEEL